jgi:uncharacterized protein (UPF0335 family)
MQQDTQLIAVAVRVLRQERELSSLAQTLGSIVGSNRTQGMDVCVVCVYSVFLLSHV